jgi:hypothetical protein
VIELLTYLLDEITAGAEIYYSGRIGGQYLKSSFILCDDFTELTSKLFLLCENPAWSDRTTRGFKSYHRVKVDVEDALAIARGGDVAAAREFHTRMRSRRDRRNRFFHGADLLDLNVTQRMCLESYCDLLQYGRLLFEKAWTDAVAGSRNLETYELLFEVERRALSDPAVASGLMRLLSSWPRNSPGTRRVGIQVAVHPEDLHLRLCVINGGAVLRDRLRTMIVT